MIKLIILGVFAMFVLGLVLVLIYRPVRTKFGVDFAPTPAPSTKGNSVKDQPAGYDENKPEPTKATTTPPRKDMLSKPLLQKSSGNAPGSSVPAGAGMEFICEGTPGLSCEVVLTDRSNANRKIALGAKTIASNNRGQYFALWEWEAARGSWDVMARVSDGVSGSETSDKQTLEVR